MPAAVPGAVSVIVPTFNRWATLGRCLHALSLQRVPPGTLDVIVVDDGSTQSPPAPVDATAYPFSLRVIRQANAGPAAARNRGLALADAPLTLFINDDTILDAGAIARHRLLHATTPGRMMVLGTFDFFPSYASTAIGQLLSSTSHLFQFGMLRSGDRADYRFAYTCNLSVPTAPAREEGFDEAFTGPAGEDIDFGLRMQRRGYSVLFDAEAKSHHDHELTVASLASTFATRGRGSVTFALKHGPSFGHELGVARALLEAASEERAALDAEIADATARLAAFASATSLPREAFHHLARLASAASLRGAVDHPAWRALAAT